MAIRKCPACLTTAPMGAVAAKSNDFVCAGCGQHLEVKEASRVLAATAGIVGGYLAVTAMPPPPPTLAWAIPALYGLLAFGCVSAVILMFTADLRVVPPPAEPVAVAPADGGHAHH